MRAFVLALLACVTAGPASASVDCPDGTRPSTWEQGDVRLVGCELPDGRWHGPRQRYENGVLRVEERMVEGEVVGPARDPDAREAPIDEHKPVDESPSDAEVTKKSATPVTAPEPEPELELGPEEKKMRLTLSGGLVLAVLIIFAAAGYTIRRLGGAAGENLAQGGALKAAPPTGPLDRHVGKVVTLSGRPQLLDPPGDDADSRKLWFHRQHQVFGQRFPGQTEPSNTWSTLNEERGYQPFSLRTGGGEVFCRTPPTEVQGAKYRTDGDEGLPAVGKVRRIEDALYAQAEVTVAGELARTDEGLAIVEHKKVGLLLAAGAPGTRSGAETAKGAGQIVAAMGCGVLALALAAGCVALLLAMW
jgi:hypothetical protein